MGMSSKIVQVQKVIGQMQGRKINKCLCNELLNSRMSHWAQRVSELQILGRALRNDHKTLVIVIPLPIYFLLTTVRSRILD